MKQVEIKTVYCIPCNMEHRLRLVCQYKSKVFKWIHRKPKKGTILYSCPVNGSFMQTTLEFPDVNDHFFVRCSLVEVIE